MTNKVPRKHAELIKAWADGAEIEYYSESLRCWQPAPISPSWDKDYKYRIKPEPKPDIVRYTNTFLENETYLAISVRGVNNLKLTFDGETGKLKSAEVINV